MPAPTTPRSASPILASSSWCIIGGGNMAGAIVRGAIASGQIGPDRFVIVEPEESKRLEFGRAGIRVFATASEGARAVEEIESPASSGHFLLAVKPQVFPRVEADLRGLLDSAPRRVVSIMAGLSTSLLQSALGTSARVIRLMPNTPAQIRRGTTAWAPGSSAVAGDEAATIELFETLGMTVRLEERLLDAFTAVAGSGPAYLFYLAESMITAAVREGIEPNAASAIVRSVLAGASELLLTKSEQTPLELRKSVTSKGGTTEAAISVFDSNKVNDILTRAIAEATARGKQLSNEPPNR
ncbi:MAG: pyrroline-5-carboxylate reductase [Phycisphaeraceae bacterium]|nr:pyrroline-5-carboxylate reductase [Phycisphaeraceae bacterium]